MFLIWKRCLGPLLTAIRGECQASTWMAATQQEYLLYSKYICCAFHWTMNMHNGIVAEIRYMEESWIINLCIYINSPYNNLEIEIQANLVGQIFYSNVNQYIWKAQFSILTDITISKIQFCSILIFELDNSGTYFINYTCLNWGYVKNIY